MKKFMVILALAALPFLLMSAATEAQQVQGKTTVVPKGKTTVVPKGKTYVKLDRNNKAIATFKAGRSMGVLNCAQVPCPSDFKAGTVCWKCQESGAVRQ